MTTDQRIILKGFLEKIDDILDKEKNLSKNLEYLDNELKIVCAQIKLAAESSFREYEKLSKTMKKTIVEQKTLKTKRNQFERELIELLRDHIYPKLSERKE